MEKVYVKEEPVEMIAFDEMAIKQEEEEFNNLELKPDPMAIKEEEQFKIEIKLDQDSAIVTGIETIAPHMENISTSNDVKTCLDPKLVSGIETLAPCIENITTSPNNNHVRTGWDPKFVTGIQTMAPYIENIKTIPTNNNVKTGLDPKYVTAIETMTPCIQNITTIPTNTHVKTSLDPKFVLVGSIPSLFGSGHGTNNAVIQQSSPTYLLLLHKHNAPGSSNWSSSPRTDHTNTPLVASSTLEQPKSSAQNHIHIQPKSSTLPNCGPQDVLNDNDSTLPNCGPPDVLNDNDCFCQFKGDREKKRIEMREQILKLHATASTARERESISLRGRIVGMHEAGKSVSEISQHLGCHPTTIKRWVTRYEKEGDLSTRVSSGRPRVTTIEEDRVITQLLSEKNPHMTSGEMKQNLDISVCKTTLRKRLCEEGWQELAQEGALGSKKLRGVHS